MVWASEVAEQIKMLVGAHVDMKRDAGGEWQDWPATASVEEGGGA
jgi:hypothetical protein